MKEKTLMSTATANILIVDDTAENLRVLENFLVTEGYRVRAAPSGKLALASAAKSMPDLMLLDINMPEMDGLEVCRRIKADPDLAELPILFLSAYTDLEHKIMAFEAGGADYVSKPFHWEEVRARVNTQLGLRRARRELLERNAELKQALADLKATQVQLVEREKMASLGVLTAGIAHEINNPINFIVAGLTALRKLTAEARGLLETYAAVLPGDSDALQAAHARRDAADLPDLLVGLDEMIGSIDVGAHRAVEIVKGLRTFARKDEEIFKDIFLKENIDSTLMILSGRLRGITVDDSQLTFHDPVEALPGKFNQIMINLLTNAADAVDAAHPDGGGRIDITSCLVERDGKAYAAVEVRDNGGGLAPEIKAKMFEPFYTTKPVGQGTGLGLAIVKSIVEEHFGILEVDSSPDTGTTFRLLIPLKMEVA